jgi:hypothetical protein
MQIFHNISKNVKSNPIKQEWPARMRPKLESGYKLYFQISQSRSLISVHCSPKKTEILLNMSDLDLRSLLYNGISVFFGL